VCVCVCIYIYICLCACVCMCVCVCVCVKLVNLPKNAPSVYIPLNFRNVRKRLQKMDETEIY
jgi:hypothetical protein